MNIYIKFYILSFLIGLNSTTLVKIAIDKEGLKSEPKNFEDTDGEFLVKLAKWSEGQWEYSSKSKFTDENGRVSLKLPAEQWNKLFDSVRIRNRRGNEKEDNYTQIGGDEKRIGNRSHIRQLAKLAISKEWQRLQQHFDEVGKNGKEVEIGSEICPQPKVAMQSPIPPHLQANYFNDVGNIQQIASINAEMPQNVQKHGKGLIAEIGGDEGRVENWPQMGPKLMHSATISASQRLIIPWHGRKQHLGQNVQNHGKDPEIVDANRPQKKQKLIHPTNNSVNLSQNPLYWKEGSHSYSRIASGHIINKGIDLNADEYERKQNEFPQINPNGFTHGNIPPANRGKPIGKWHQNLPVQPMNAGESMGGKKSEFNEFTSNEFSQQQGNLPSIDEIETEDPMEFWRQILHKNLPVTPTSKSMSGNQHEFAQIKPNKITHQTQRNISPPKNAAKFFGDRQKNLPIQTTKNSLSFDATGSQHYLKAPNMDTAPFAKQHFAAGFK